MGKSIGKFNLDVHFIKNTINDYISLINIIISKTFVSQMQTTAIQ